MGKVYAKQVINRWIQLGDCLRIDSDNKVNVFSSTLPNLGRIHKVLDENSDQIKVQTVWINKNGITKVYGYKPPPAYFVF